jgi:hypothetical protein
MVIAVLSLNKVRIPALSYICNELDNLAINADFFELLTVLWQF